MAIINVVNWLGLGDINGIPRVLDAGQCNDSYSLDRLEKLGIPTFPLINLWEGEDDQIPALRETAEELGFRDPIVGNLFRDGGEALAPQLDAFVEAVSDEALPERVVVEKNVAKRVAKSHKIRTDTGIDITFPAEYGENPDFIEFVSGPNGLINIELKNIGHIENR